MHDLDPTRAQARALLQGSLATLAIFAAHHVYGAVRYATPWRHHAAIVAALVAVALVVPDRLHRARSGTPAGRAAAWALLAVAVAFPVLLVGGFEGAYNHVAKDALWLAGAPRDLLLTLFPPPRYELPDDLVFEFTGVLQVLPSAYAARAALRLFRALRGASSRPVPSGSSQPA